jgi:glycosyltransferase involved in cell wall biosynthesis/tetratricopeptide (TPR) repeat protein
MVGGTRALVMTSYGQILRAASVVMPHNPWLISKRGRIYARLAKRRRAQGDAAGALTLLDRVLVDMPQNERLLRERAFAVARLANVRRAEGDAIRALSLIDEALVQMPEDLRLLAARAGMLHALRSYRVAMEAWRRLTELAPTDVRGWAGMARAMYMIDRSDLIEPLIAEYLRVLGDRPERYVRAANVALRGGQRTTFQRLLARADTDAVGNAAALSALAELHLGDGSIGEALNRLDEVLELAPHDKKVRARRQKMLHALRLTGIEGETLTPHQRARLRMPDLALQALLRRADGPRQATADGVVMVCSSLGPGGVQRQILNSVRGLRSVGSTRTVVLMPLVDDDPAIHRFHDASLASLSVRIEPCPGASVEMPRLSAAIGSDAKPLLKLVPEALRADIGVLTSRFLKNPPEVVHAWGDRQNVAAGVAAVLAGVPRVVLSDRSIAPADSRTVPSYFHAVYTGLLEHPSTILVNNSAAGARTYGQWLGIDPARVRVIYNGVDIDGLERARDPEATTAHRARLMLPDDAKVVGSLFRFSREKRPLLWLEAAAVVARRCPAAQFLVLGDGPMRDDMASAARALGIADRLHMPGLARDVAPWYDLMDVVLLTSRYEGTSNTALEAQALGKPVVAPAVGGMPETFAPGTSGFLVTPDPSPVEIAECVTRALTDTAWRDQAEQAARAFVRGRFSIERMTADTLDLYGFESAPAGRDRHQQPVQATSHAG